MGREAIGVPLACSLVSHATFYYPNLALLGEVLSPNRLVPFRMYFIMPSECALKNCCWDGVFFVCGGGLFVLGLFF